MFAAVDMGRGCKVWLNAHQHAAGSLARWAFMMTKEYAQAGRCRGTFSAGLGGRSTTDQKQDHHQHDGNAGRTGTSSPVDRFIRLGLTLIGVQRAGLHGKQHTRVFAWDALSGLSKGGTVHLSATAGWRWVCVPIRPVQAAATAGVALPRPTAQPMRPPMTVHAAMEAKTGPRNWNVFCHSLHSSALQVPSSLMRPRM